MAMEKTLGLKNLTWKRKILFIIIGLGLILVASTVALADKTCYNGNLDSSEGGRDYCIYTGEAPDGNQCLNMFGRCGSIVSVEALPGEENSYIPVNLVYYNPGTIYLTPAVRMDLQVIDSSNVLKSTRISLGALGPGEQKSYDLLLDTSNVPAGKYDLWVIVSSGRKEILQKFDYEVLAWGKIVRAGNLDLTSVSTSDEGVFAITENFESTASLPYTAKAITNIYGPTSAFLDTQAKTFYIKPGETKEIAFNFDGLGPGEYRAVSFVEGAGQKKSVSFTIPAKVIPLNEADMPIGNFLLSAPGIYLMLAGIGVFILTFAIARKIGGSGGKEMIRKSE